MRPSMRAVLAMPLIAIAILTFDSRAQTDWQKDIKCGAKKAQAELAVAQKDTGRARQILDEMRQLACSPADIERLDRTLGPTEAPPQTTAPSPDSGAARSSQPNASALGERERVVSSDIPSFPGVFNTIKLPQESICGPFGTGMLSVLSPALEAQCKDDEALSMRSITVKSCSCKKSGEDLLCSISGSGRCRKVKIKPKVAEARPEKMSLVFDSEDGPLSFNEASACNDARRRLWASLLRRCSVTAQERYGKRAAEEVDPGITSSSILDSKCECRRTPQQHWVCKLSADALCVEHAARPVSYVFDGGTLVPPHRKPSCANGEPPSRAEILKGCNSIEDATTRVFIRDGRWAGCDCRSDPAKQETVCASSYEARCDWLQARDGDSFD